MLEDQIRLLTEAKFKAEEAEELGIGRSDQIAMLIETIDDLLDGIKSDIERAQERRDKAEKSALESQYWASVI